MSEILATDQFVEKAKEAVTDVIYNIDASCDAFDLNAEETAEVLEKFMLDMFIPSLKDCYLRSLQFALWGDDVSVKPSTCRQRLDYNSINRRTKRVEGLDISKLIFSTQEKAEHLITELQGSIDVNGYVTVGYLYELMAESSPYTAEYYGWKDNLTDKYEVVKERAGYRLILPDPILLEEFK